MPLWLGALYVAAFAAIVLRAYPRASARIRRPSLWIELAVVMLLAGLLLGGVRHGAAGIAEGLHAGSAMVLRAILVLFGFTAVSVELRNPVILSWVERRRLRGLSDALGVAFGTLPAFTAALSRPGASWRRPGHVVAASSSRWPTRSRSRRETAPARRRTVVVTGDTGSGKTTRAAEVVERLRARGLRVGGILAPGLLEDGRRTGFDVLDLAPGSRPRWRASTQADAAPHARNGAGLPSRRRASRSDSGRSAPMPRGADVVARR